MWVSASFCIRAGAPLGGISRGLGVLESQDWSFGCRRLRLGEGQKGKMWFVRGSPTPILEKRFHGS